MLKKISHSLFFAIGLTSVAAAEQILIQSAHYTRDILPPPPGETFDASAGEWGIHIGGRGRTCNLGTFPLQMRWHANQTLRHALVQGNIASELHEIEEGEFCSSAVGVLIRDNAANSTLDGLRIDGAWDAIRITGATADNFEIKNTWVSKNRSRCLQNLSGSSGLLKDSLFESCFRGFFVGGDAPENTLTIDNVLLQVKPFDAISTQALTIGGDGSGNVLFGSSGAPKLAISNSVFAYDSPALLDDLSQLTNMIGTANGRVSTCTNNQILWISEDLDTNGNPNYNNDDWYPGDLKELRSCFEVISGLHAKVEWERKRCDWINTHNDTVLNTLPGSTRRNANDPTTCDISSIAELTVLDGGLYSDDDAFNPEGNQFRRFEANKVYDASETTFYLNNCRVENPDDFPGLRRQAGCAHASDDTPAKPVNFYPVSLGGPQNTIIRPLIAGEVPQDALWHLSYLNSAGILIGSNAVNSKVYGARINNSWDAVRVTADNFVISDVYSTGGRDDCIENDPNKSGQILDSLFDDCNFGISLRGPSELPNAEFTDTLVIDGLLLRLTEHRELRNENNSDSEELKVLRHAFKARANSAGLKIYNSIFAYDGKEIHGSNHLATMLAPNPELGIDKLKECANNKILWMDSDELPPHLTEFTIPTCFEVITGVQARNLWENARCDWLNAHPENITRRMPDEAQTCTPPAVLSVSASANTITLGDSVTMNLTLGTSESETYADEDILWFSSINDQLSVNGLTPVLEGLSIGEHKIRAQITNTAGAKAHIETTITVNPPDHSVDLASDIRPPLTVGDITTLRATVNGDAQTDYQYLFEVRNISDGAQWQALNTLGDNDTLIWNTSGYNGKIRLRVTAVSKLDNSFSFSGTNTLWVNSTNPVTQVTLIPDQSLVTNNNSVLISAQAYSPLPSSYDYRFELVDTTTNTKYLLTDFSLANTYLWDTSAIQGKHRVLVSAKAANSNDQPVKNSVVVWLNSDEPVTSTNLQTIPASPAAPGNLITLQASVDGGSGSAEYAFQYRLVDGDQWITIQDFDTTSSTVWNTSGLRGDYRLRVLARNAGTLDKPVRKAIKLFRVE
ncbi:hypothetical protein KFE80_05460 [bacterium SCSIO 12696]|nr:hypothetical protein KFE80_05460 [bacterium SCSIO 12696]